MSATTPECADPVSGDESSAQQVRLLVCQLQRCSRRALFCLGAEPHWRTWAACAGAWASLSACTSRRATCSSSSVAGCTWQLSRGCAQILKPCPHIGSHALPGACSCTPVPARRPPASVSPAEVLSAGSNLSQPLLLRADGPVFYLGQDKPAHLLQVVRPGARPARSIPPQRSPAFSAGFRRPWLASHGCCTAGSASTAGYCSPCLVAKEYWTLDLEHS